MLNRVIKNGACYYVTIRIIDTNVAGSISGPWILFTLSGLFTKDNPKKSKEIVKEAKKLVEGKVHCNE
jgi:hypothetical protein